MYNVHSNGGKSHHYNWRIAELLLQPGAQINVKNEANRIYRYMYVIILTATCNKWW